MKACFAFLLLLSLSEENDGSMQQNFHRHLQITFQPVSYTMRNGDTLNSIKLWDDTYSRPRSDDGDYLYGGVGKLTDGVKAEVDVDTNPDLYVGWKSSVNIEFFFETKSIIDNVKISVDDSGKNGICRPKEVIIDSVHYEFPENSVAGPHEADIALTSPVISSSVIIVLIKKCDWIAVSEIEFGQNNHMTQVQPVRYKMFNGGEMNGMTFWDDKYSPAPTESYEYLFGGLGQLTDGIKAEESWNVNSSPYVGWEKNHPPDITFFFEDICFIDEVRISVDDFDSEVCPPKNAIFSYIMYDFPENDGTGPYEAVIELENNKISKEFHLVAENECDWLMISEVEFFARDMDRDGIPDGTDACLHTFEDEIDCGDEGRYIWNGTHWITKDENGKIVPANHYDMKTLRGCSCEQILDILGPCENNDCRRNGCTKEKLDEWMDCEPPTMSPTPMPSNVPSFIFSPPSGFPSLSPSSSPIAPPPCSDWCYGGHNFDKYNKLDEKTMCQYYFHCSGCPECENRTKPTCDRTLCESDQPWKEKCTKSKCGSCPECEDEHSFPVCDEKWCKDTGSLWDEKCNLTRCSDCCQCEERSLLLYCHKFFCDQIQETWNEKCKMRECGACNKCVEIFSSPVCEENICNDKQMTWDEKCKMQECGTCLECAPICEEACENNDYSWDENCLKKNCSACPQCYDGVFVFCERDCIEKNNLSWEEKCDTKNCSGCPQCFDKNDPPVCRKPWCEMNKKTWMEKCSIQLCGACPQCHLY